MTRRILINVGGLWRTEVELEEEATWYDLKIEIEKVTGIWPCYQIFEPCGEYDKRCELEEGDNVFCDWELYGDHPLHFAACYGNIKAIVSWIASGADINVVNEHKQTPLMVACLLLQEKSVIELLRLGANVHMKNIDGETALHRIVFYIDSDKMEKIERMAKILIKAGCDPTIRDNENETFIDILKKCDCEKLATKLEKWMKEME
jgi:hypothetical protein